jgi:hypothetical protein
MATFDSTKTELRKRKCCNSVEWYSGAVGVLFTVLVESEHICRSFDSRQACFPVAFSSSSATITSCQPALFVSTRGKSSQRNGNQEYAGWFRDRINRNCRVVTKEVLSISSS